MLANETTSEVSARLDLEKTLHGTTISSAEKHFVPPRCHRLTLQDKLATRSMNCRRIHWLP